MADNLNPGDAPEVGGDHQTAKTDATSPKAEAKPKELKWFKKESYGHIFAILAEFGFICWVWTEFHKSREFSDIMFFLACLVFLYLAVCFSILKVSEKIWPACVTFVVLFSATCLTAFSNAKPREPVQKPNFEVSLQIGDTLATTIMLTNEALFGMSILNTITNFPNGVLFFNGVPLEWLVIPITPEQSNMMFGFMVQNTSGVTVDDLTFGIGVPKDWKVGFDEARLEPTGMHISCQGQELKLTNWQFWAEDSRHRLFPTDRSGFAITNFAIPLWHGPSTKVESMAISVRCSGFESLMAANVIFLQEPSTNHLKPFLMTLAIGKDGKPHPIVSAGEFEKELEASQK